MNSLNKKSKDNTKETKNGDKKKKIWVVNIINNIKAWVKSMLKPNKECMMNMKIQGLLSLLTERMLDWLLQLIMLIWNKSLKVNTSKWEMICKINWMKLQTDWIESMRTQETLSLLTTRRKDLSWQELMRTQDFLFQTIMKELGNNLVMRKKLKELIFKLNWNKWELKKILDTLNYQTSRRCPRPTSDR